MSENQKPVLLASTPQHGLYVLFGRPRENEINLFLLVTVWMWTAKFSTTNANENPSGITAGMKQFDGKHESGLSNLILIGPIAKNQKDKLYWFGWRLLV